MGTDCGVFAHSSDGKIHRYWLDRWYVFSKTFQNEGLMSGPDLIAKLNEIQLDPECENPSYWKRWIASAKWSVTDAMRFGEGTKFRLCSEHSSEHGYFYDQKDFKSLDHEVPDHYQ